MTTTDSPFFTHEEAATVARCHPNTLHAWAPPCRVRRGRRWLYPREEFLRWLAGTPSEERVDHGKENSQNRRSLYKRGNGWAA